MPTPAETFQAHRERLLRLAYGMLGRVSDAEDTIQDAYLRWRTVDHEEIEDPEAYLSTIVTRLSLDKLRAAESEREQYTGPWLPEPVVETDDAPDGRVETKGELSMALMVLLEELRPVERAVYVLREAFERPYAWIARRVDRSESHCRKIAERARAQLEQEGRPVTAPPNEHSNLLSPFVEAISKEDDEALAALLSEDAVSYTDGGDLPDAAKRPILGRERVVRFLLSIRSKAPEGLEIERAEVNGRPGLLARLSGRVHSVWALRAGEGQIQELYCIRNPEKLNQGTPS